jgi:hypothetical protein
MTSSITTSRAWLLLTFLLLPQLAPADTGVPPLPTLTVRVLPGTDPSITNDLANVRPVTGPAALQLDLAYKRILDAAGQIVVESDGSNLIQLQQIVDKWRYVQSLGAIAASHPLRMRIDFGSLPLRAPPSPPKFYNNEVVSFVVTDAKAGSQLVMFNLSPIGTIQLLYVREGKPGEDSDATASVRCFVRSPFGVEHVVAVSATDPERMHALIETVRAHGMLDTQGEFLQQLMALRNVRVGMLVTYTCASAANCKRWPSSDPP